jgi:hypothetical protein
VTPLEARKIRDRCKGLCPSPLGPHPLEGKSVAEWVAEARAGWPRPIPYNPSPAALRRIAENAEVEEWTT